MRLLIFLVILTLAGCNKESTTTTTTTIKAETVNITITAEVWAELEAGLTALP